MYGYPRKITHWICSNGQIVATEEEAEAIERSLEREDKNYTFSTYQNDKNPFDAPLDVRF